mmetsp:Transcript_133215/g.231026  ORF Transcript_133215/g.231026 Transcript_133215/m.231026 type:complete len:90 (+) Transcript_133215:786-1055(+)
MQKCNTLHGLTEPPWVWLAPAVTLRIECARKSKQLSYAKFHGYFQSNVPKGLHITLVHQDICSYSAAPSPYVMRARSAQSVYFSVSDSI